MSRAYSFSLVIPPTALVTPQSYAFLLTPGTLISLCHSELLQQVSPLHFTTDSNYHKKHPKHLSQLLYDFFRGIPLLYYKQKYSKTILTQKPQFYYQNQTKQRKNQTFPKSIDYELERESILFPCLESDIVIKDLSKSTE